MIKHTLKLVMHEIRRNNRYYKRLTHIKFLYVADWSTVTPEASRYYDLGKGTRYCDERVCLSVSQFVCVCVCLRVCMRAYLRNYSSIFTHVYRGSVLHWRRCDTLCTSVPVDGVICLHIMARDMRREMGV